MVATISREVNRTGKASRSSEETPIIGTLSAWAMALAEATPTRRPVNSPGPRSTATTLISFSSIRACRQVNSIAGVSTSACCLPRNDCVEANTPSCPPTATLT